VTFRYFSSGEPVLNKVSLRRSGPDHRAAGATGSGKTTIINLLPRFYDPTGPHPDRRHDLRDVTLDSLRSQIGIVLQETTLFTGTIRTTSPLARPGHP